MTGIVWPLLVLALSCGCTLVSSKQLFYTTTNGVQIPLMGIGVGNMPSNHVAQAVRTALDAGISLIDTAAASSNENVIREGLDMAKATQTVQPFLLTKVWYTHLGYARTMLSVEQSLLNFGVDVIDCVLIHWPRCDDSVSWMNCETEENDLLDIVKQAGPAPHAVDASDTPPWHGSWRALEELYKAGKVRAIGVSNFNFDDMTQLLEIAQVTPMIVQGNIWAVFFDPYLINLLKQHNIMFQAYAAMNALLPASNTARVDEAAQKRVKFAFEYIETEGRKFFRSKPGSESITGAQIVLAYLMSSGVGVIPRTHNPHHLAQNAFVNGVQFPIDNPHTHGIRTAIEEVLRAYNGMPHEFVDKQHAQEL